MHSPMIFQFPCPVSVNIYCKKASKNPDNIYIKTIRFIFQSACQQINPGDSFPSSGIPLVYLDIETTGLDRHYQSITTIALYDGHEIKTYVHGQNLDDFIDEI